MLVKRFAARYQDGGGATSVGEREREREMEKDTRLNKCFHVHTPLTYNPKQSQCSQIYRMNNRRSAGKVKVYITRSFKCGGTSRFKAALLTWPAAVRCHPRCRAASSASVIKPRSSVSSLSGHHRGSWGSSTAIAAAAAAAAPAAEVPAEGV